MDYLDKYIGIPYKTKGITLDGCDCLGLIELIYKNEFNVTLPLYPHLDTVDLDITSKAIEHGKESWKKLDKPEAGCVVLLNICGYPVHIGMAINETEMLHSLKGHDSVIESFTGMKWNKRIDGFYRYEAIT